MSITRLLHDLSNQVINRKYLLILLNKYYGICWPHSGQMHIKYVFQWQHSFQKHMQCSMHATTEMQTFTENQENMLESQGLNS